MRPLILLMFTLTSVWCADPPHFPTPTIDDKWATALKNYFERVGALSITLHLDSGKTLEIKSYALQGAAVTGNALDGTAVLVRAGAIAAVTYKPDAPAEPAKP